MRLPEPLEWLSLLSSLVLATAPAAMALYKLGDGAILAALVYGFAAALMFVLPDLFIRRLPGPRELVRSSLRKIPGPMTLLRRRRSDENDD